MEWFKTEGPRPIEFEVCKLPAPLEDLIRLEIFEGRFKARVFQVVLDQVEFKNLVKILLRFDEKSTAQ